MLKTMKWADEYKRCLTAVPDTTRAFLTAAHRMTAEHETTKAAAKADVLALLTILEETTQSRSIAERCAKAKAVLS
jgi:hypothetical protein